MPSFLPFRALRPTKKKVSEFSAKTSDFKNQEEIVADMLTNTQSYYYVTKRFLVYKDNENIEYHFAHGAKYINEKIKKGDLTIDSKPGFFVYRQTDFVSNKVFTGFIGLADVEEVENSLIKKHEHTKIQREDYLYKQLFYTGVLGEPVLIGHENDKKIDDLIAEITKNDVEYNFNTIDNKNHKIWRVTDSELLEKIYHSFQNINAFYIADGHHRCASVIRNYKLNPNVNNRFFMIYLLSENQLNIESFHRIVSGTGTLNYDSFKNKINDDFTVESFDENKLYIPQKHNEFGLLSREYSLKLTFKSLKEIKNPESKLDVSILEKYLLKPVFEINHPRTDKRLSFVASTEDIEKSLNLLSHGSIDYIISNYPVSFNEVKEIADSNKVMPPKSTYIEPKLRGGLIIQKFY
ncbi:MAG: DUF1015 domain-containing protein [Bacteroidetes bacterium]|nr:DUF1015 domain-containing protein [Bacteroidota bacterium]